MNIILQTIRGVSRGLAHGLRALALSLLLFDVIYAVLLALLAFWIASHGSWARGLIAGVLALILSIIAGTIVSVQMGILQSVKAAVQRAAIGRITLDAIVHRLPASPEAGWTLDELETALNRAAASILGETPPMRLLSIPFWLAVRVQRVVVWATVRIVLRQASREHEGTRRVDIAAVRDHLANVIDRVVLERISEQLTRLSASLFVAATVAAVVLAFALRLLPFLTVIP